MDWTRVEQALERSSPRPSRLKDIAARLDADEQRLGELLSARARHGGVLRIADRVYASLACGKALVEAFKAACESSAGGVSVAAYRDRTGLNRREAVQVLEYFDRVGYSRLRAGEHVLQIAVDRQEARVA
jgi:selenocysteine-specific elongation factor